MNINIVRIMMLLLSIGLMADLQAMKRRTPAPAAAAGETESTKGAKRRNLGSSAAAGSDSPTRSDDDSGKKKKKNGKKKKTDRKAAAKSADVPEEEDAKENLCGFCSIAHENKPLACGHAYCDDCFGNLDKDTCFLCRESADSAPVSAAAAAAAACARVEPVSTRKKRRPVDKEKPASPAAAAAGEDNPYSQGAPAAGKDTQEKRAKKENLCGFCSVAHENQPLACGHAYCDDCFRNLDKNTCFLCRESADLAPVSAAGSGDGKKTKEKKEAKRAEYTDDDDTDNADAPSSLSRYEKPDSKESLALATIILRFRKEILSAQTSSALTNIELLRLFPNLMLSEKAGEKINAFITYFAYKTAPALFSHKLVLSTLYSCPPYEESKPNEGYLFACACGDVTLGERLLLTLKQVDAIIASYPDKTEQVVHTSFAAGGAIEQGSKLLQLFMFVKGLLDFGYENILVKIIDSDIWSPADMMKRSLLAARLHSEYGPDNIDIYCDTGGCFGAIPKYTEHKKATNPLVTLLTYRDAKLCAGQIRNGAPRSMSFDIIDFNISGEKHTAARTDFIDCILATSFYGKDPIIYEGFKHRITSHDIRDLTNFMKSRG